MFNSECKKNRNTYFLTCFFLCSAVSIPLFASEAAYAQTSGPALSFNVLNFGDLENSNRPSLPGEGEIPPDDLPMINALMSNVTRSMLGTNDINSETSLNSSMASRFTSQLANSDYLLKVPRRSFGNIALLNSGDASQRNGVGSRAAGASRSAQNTSSQPLLQSAIVSGPGGITSGLVSADNQNTGQMNRHNQTRANSGLSDNSEAAIKSQANSKNFSGVAGFVAVVSSNVVSGQETAGPASAAELPGGKINDAVAVTSLSNGNLNGNLAGGNLTGGQTAGSVTALGLRVGGAAAADPLQVFSGVTDAVNTPNSSAAGGGSAGVNINSPTLIANKVQSVLPENHSALLLCSGLLAFIPMLWRQRNQRAASTDKMLT